MLMIGSSTSYSVNAVAGRRSCGSREAARGSPELAGHAVLGRQLAQRRDREVGLAGAVAAGEQQPRSPRSLLALLSARGIVLAVLHDLHERGRSSASRRRLELRQQAVLIARRDAQPLQQQRLRRLRGQLAAGAHAHAFDRRAVAAAPTTVSKPVPRQRSHSAMAGDYLSAARPARPRSCRGSCACAERARGPRPPATP